MCHTYSYGQAEDCPILDGRLDEIEARSRRNFFDSIKRQKVLTNFNTTDLEFNADAVVELLTKFASNKDYDGVRAYFAIGVAQDIPADFTANRFYLVLIPTKYSDDRDETDTYSDDDRSNAHITNDKGQFIKIDNTNRVFVINSINRYLTKAVPAIQTYFQKNYGVTFQETHNLWYDKKVLFSGGRDLLSTLKNETCKIKKVKFDFASWTIHVPDARFSLKMDLLFELLKEGETSGGYFTSLTKAQLKKKRELESEFLSEGISKEKMQILAYQLEAFLAEFADTAVPCPPAKCPR